MLEEVLRATVAVRPRIRRCRPISHPRRAAPPKLARIELPKSTREGNLAFVIAVILMLAISAALLLLHPEGVAAATAAIQAR